MSNAPPLLLAHKWKNTDPTGWWMSEKLDGLRAYWNGTQLLSRLGNAFSAPEWFIESLPKETLDGELWIGRGQFQHTTGVVRTKLSHPDWQQIKFAIFDAPNIEKPFEDRLNAINALVAKIQIPNIYCHDQSKCMGSKHLLEELERIESLGGEGVMLREPGSFYKIGRHKSLLKVKTFNDMEASVTEHLIGKGKYKGMCGALLVKLDNGIQFKVGTGLSDEDRLKPPPVGATIIFRYQELSNTGVPRFPSYVGERIDL